MHVCIYICSVCGTCIHYGVCAPSLCISVCFVHDHVLYICMAVDSLGCQKDTVGSWTAQRTSLE